MPRGRKGTSRPWQHLQPLRAASIHSGKRNYTLLARTARHSVCLTSGVPRAQHNHPRRTLVDRRLRSFTYIKEVYVGNRLFLSVASVASLGSAKDDGFDESQGAAMAHRCLPCTVLQTLTTSRAVNGTVIVCARSPPVVLSGCLARHAATAAAGRAVCARAAAALRGAQVPLCLLHGAQHQGHTLTATRQAQQRRGERRAGTGLATREWQGALRVLADAARGARALGRAGAHQPMRSHAEALSEARRVPFGCRCHACAHRGNRS